MTRRPVYERAALWNKDRAIRAELPDPVIVTDIRAGKLPITDDFATRAVSGWERSATACCC